MIAVPAGIEKNLMLPVFLRVENVVTERQSIRCISLS